MNKNEAVDGLNFDLLCYEPQNSDRLLPKSGNLRDARGFDDGRFALAISKSRRFVLIGIDAAEAFTVRVMHCHLPVVVLSSLVCIKCLALG